MRDRDDALLGNRMQNSGIRVRVRVRVRVRGLRGYIYVGNVADGMDRELAGGVLIWRIGGC